MSDKDSLFGSPPPSPSARGRSPSLALPELPAAPSEGQASSQNVGTIALPGSHEQCSELPVFIDPALPIGKPPALPLRPPAQRAPQRAPPTRPRAVGSAPRRTRSPSRHDTPAPRNHNPQTDRTLRDLVGLISHFEPTINTSAQRLPPGTSAPIPGASQHPLGTAENPIEVEALPANLQWPTVFQNPQNPALGQGPADAVNSALVALAGTVASALKLPPAPKDVPSLPKPTVNNVLQLIKNDPKLIPVLQATYEYLGSVPNLPTQPPRSFSHVSTDDESHPPKRRRYAVEKGSQVPAGAGHWNVPFPFAPGQGPKDYPSQWQLDRGRRVLGDLLGLFERAFARARGDPTGGKTATKNGRPMKRRRMSRPGSSAPSARSEHGGSASGPSSQGCVSSGSKDVSPLDHTRMNEWLSSVPAVATSSIVESMGPMPSPSPSDPAPVSDNLHDLMALLSSGSGDPSVTPVEDTGGGFDYSFNFDTVFADVGLTQDDVQWHSLLGPGPGSQSINDITAFPMGFTVNPPPEASTSQPQRPAPHPQPPEFAIDPLLMALSQLPPAAPGWQSSGLDGVSSEKTASADLDFLSAESDPLASLLGPTTQSQATQPETMGLGLCLSGSGNTDEPLPSDARSIATVPTVMSATSSQPVSRHTSVAATDLQSPSVLSSALPSKVQRRADSLAKAREHRARILKAIEKAKMERWETTIEGGVLMNLLVVDVPQ